MLYLSEQDIRKVVTMKDVIDSIDKTYEIYEKKQFEMPIRNQITKNGNSLLLMPSITDNYFTTKLVTIFPNNIDVPTLHGLVIVNSSTTGEIKAVIDGTFLTGMRTGAIGGSAARHLANKNAESLAIIGTGTQGLYQAIAVCTERNIKHIHLFNRSPDRISSFIENLKEWISSDIIITVTESVEEAIINSEIIVTATTSNDPVLPNDESILKGKLYIGVGSFQPKMREFPEALYRLSKKILIDTEDAIEESGDIVDPLKNDWFQDKNIQTMSSFIRNKEEINISENNCVIFKSTGMALFDSVVSSSIYEKAYQKNVGSTLTTK